MSAATVTFLVIGGIGVLLLAASLLGADAFDVDGPVPVPAVAAMLGAFGFAAAIADASLQSRAPAPLLVAAGVGVAVAVPAGWLAFRLVRAAHRMPTDATPRRDDLIGLLGVVITPIPEDGYGEVRVTLGGQPVKLHARADGPVPRGAQVFVISAPSDTSVVVEQTPGLPDPSGDAP
ncbi:MAG: NfeD family protein [Micromonosporaceae bacterium]